MYIYIFIYTYTYIALGWFVFLKIKLRERERVIYIYTHTLHTHMHMLTRVAPHWLIADIWMYVYQCTWSHGHERENNLSYTSFLNNEPSWMKFRRSHPKPGKGIHSTDGVGMRDYSLTHACYGHVVHDDFCILICLHRLTDMQVNIDLILWLSYTYIYVYIYDV